LELLPLIKYEIVSQFLNFDNLKQKEIKEKWIINNIKWIFRYNLDILKLYIICECKHSKYYLISDKIYGKHKIINPKIISSLYIIYDLERVCEIGNLKVLKYIFNILFEEFGENYINLNVRNIQISNYLYKGIILACKNNNLDIIKYIFKLTGNDYFNNSIRYFLKISINNNNFEIFKFLSENNNIENFNTDDLILLSIQNCNFECLRYLTNNYNIKYNFYINILKTSSINNNLEMFTYILNNFQQNNISMILENYGYELLQISSINKNNEITNYLLDNLSNKDKILDSLLQSYNIKDIEIFINKTNYIFKFGVIPINKIFKSKYIYLVMNMYKNNDFKYDIITNILKNNSESECLEFIKYCKKRIILDYDNIVSTLIEEKYINIIIYLYDKKCINIHLHNLISILSISKSEKDYMILLEKLFDYKFHDYEELLYDSIKRGYLNVVKKYHNKIIQYDYINFIMLLHASNFGHLEIVKYLVNLGTDVNYININPLIKNNIKIDGIKYNINKCIFLNIFNNNKNNINFNKSKYFDIIKYLINSGLIMLLSNVDKFVKDDELHYEVVKYILNIYPPCKYTYMGKILENACINNKVRSL